MHMFFENDQGVCLLEPLLLSEKIQYLPCNSALQNCIREHYKAFPEPSLEEQPDN